MLDASRLHEIQRAFDQDKIVINQVTSRMEVHSMAEGGFNINAFREIDPMPQVMQHQILDAQDLCIFKWADRQEVDQIMVDQADMDVVDHLQDILDKQAKKQRELRDKAATGEKKQQSNVIQLIKMA